MGDGTLYKTSNGYREIFREPPLISYRKGKSLKDLLVRAKFWRWYHFQYERLRARVVWCPSLIFYYALTHTEAAEVANDEPRANTTTVEVIKEGKEAFCRGVSVLWHQVKLMMMTNHKKWNVREIVRNSEEYFWGSREHGAEFLGTGELSKSEFRGTPSFIFGEQGNNCKFL